MEEVSKVKYKDCYSEASAIVHRKVGTSKKFSEADKRDVTALLTNHLLDCRERWQQETNNIYTQLQGQQQVLRNKKEYFRAIKADAVRFARGHVAQLDSHAHDMRTTTELLQKLSSFISDNKLGGRINAGDTLENAFFIDTLDQLLERIGKVIQHTEALTYERQKCLLLLQHSYSITQAPSANQSIRGFDLSPFQSSAIGPNGGSSLPETFSGSLTVTKREEESRSRNSDSDYFRAGISKESDDLLNPCKALSINDVSGSNAIREPQSLQRNGRFNKLNLHPNQDRKSANGNRSDDFTGIADVQIINSRRDKVIKNGDESNNAKLLRVMISKMDNIKNGNITLPARNEIRDENERAPLRNGVTSENIKATPWSSKKIYVDADSASKRYTKLCRHNNGLSTSPNDSAKSSGQAQHMIIAKGIGKSSNKNEANSNHEICRTSNFEKPLGYNECSNRKVSNRIGSGLSNQSTNGLQDNERHSAFVTLNKTTVAKPSEGSADRSGHRNIQLDDLTGSSLESVISKSPSSDGNNSTGNFYDEVKKDDKNLEENKDDNCLTGSDSENKSENVIAFKWNHNSRENNIGLQKQITNLSHISNSNGLQGQVTNVHQNGTNFQQPVNRWSMVTRQLGQMSTNCNGMEKASYLEKLLAGDTNFSESSKKIPVSADKDRMIEEMTEDLRELENEVRELAEISGEMSERIRVINRELEEQDYDNTEDLNL